MTSAAEPVRPGCRAGIANTVQTVHAPTWRDQVPGLATAAVLLMLVTLPVVALVTLLPRATAPVAAVPRLASAAIPPAAATAEPDLLAKVTAEAPEPGAASTPAVAAAVIPIPIPVPDPPPVPAVTPAAESAVAVSPMPAVTLPPIVPFPVIPAPAVVTAAVRPSVPPGPRLSARATAAPARPAAPGDARCRSLVVQMQLGEEITHADRSFLRNGCR